MPPFLVHVGITLATFLGNSYLQIGGPLKYGTNLLALSSTLLVLLRNKFLVPFMFLPSIFLSRTPDHVTYVSNTHTRMQRMRPDACEFFTLTTRDGVRIDAMTLRHPEHLHVPIAQTKWMIWFNPNGAAYEELIEFLERYAARLHVSLLAFNYRGVARSQGMPQVAEDLVTDGLAAMDYLLKQGVESKNILLHGHSMGGAVASKVRALYPDGPIISDRSFRSLNHVVLALVVHEPALGALVGGLVGGLLGGVVGGTYMSSYSSAVYSSFAGLFVSGFLGYHWAHIHSPVLQIALKALQWDFDVESVWNKITGHKLVIYHALDGVISHDKASMFSSISLLSEKERAGTKLMKLDFEHYERRQAVTTRHQMYHVYPLDTVANDWELIIKEAKAGLHIED